MEYLFFSHSSLTPPAAQDLFDVSRISYRPSHAPVSLGRHHLVTNAEVAQSGELICTFMGSVFSGHRFMDNFTPRSPERLISLCKTIAQSPEEVTGTFTCLVHDSRSNTTEIYLDDLNSGPCYYTRHGTGFAVSNNIHMVAGWLRAQGVEPTRSIEPFMADAGFGCGLMCGTLYREIASIKPEQRLRADERLTTMDQEPAWARFLSADYEELIALASSRIADRMEALTLMRNDKALVIDVTGGMDSRMLIAALVQSGAQQHWCFNTLFNHPNPDGNFAEFLGHKLGMKRAQLAHGGLKYVNPYAQFCFDLYHSMGTENKGGYRPNYVHAEVLRAHGCFGELGGKSQDTKRFFRGADDQDSPKAAMLNYMNGVRKNTCDAGMTPAFDSWASRVLVRAVTEILDKGCPARAMPALFYRRAKARSHYGYLAHIRSLRTGYPSVLNDACLTAAAIKIGPRQSLLGKVNFDIIRRLGGDELAALPLVLSRWQRGMFRTREDFARYSNPPITPESKRMFSNPCPETVVPIPVEYPFSYREKSSHHDWPDVDRSVPRKFIINQLRQIAHAVLKEGPIHPQVSEYVPESVLERLLAADLDAVSDIGSMNVLKFFNSSELWLRGRELSYYPSGET